MDIGKEVREIEFEPLEAPAEQPVTPEPAPAEPEPVREPVPAGSVPVATGGAVSTHGGSRDESAESCNRGLVGV